MEHQAACARLGQDVHRGLRDVYDRSYYRRGWYIDNHLSGLGGVVGTPLSPIGFCWLALTERATRHPLEIVKETRRQLAAVMETKTLLVTSIVDGDAAAKRLAAFLGFEVLEQTEGSRAETRYGRRRLVEFIEREQSIRMPMGGGYVIPLSFVGT